MKSILFRFTALLFLAASINSRAALTPEETQFFEKKIQPIFVNNCFKCHSEAGTKDGGKIKGGLRLDTREGLFKGGDSGPVISPGKPEASLLIKAVRYVDNDLKMPPSDKKLSDAQIADLEKWVKMGAPDPRSGPATVIDLYAIEKAKATNHWAFQKIAPPQPPSVADTNGWVQSPIDKYILTELRKQNLAPSKKADKVSLIRRATFDLIGLPPTPKEVDDFVADTSPEAFSKLIDRLLDSPRYGERWGRYWLDLARYADTKGSIRDESFVGSYTYRDYVIRAFNEDLPYDKFLMQQIAADKIPGEDKRNFAALGFLTLGNTFNNNNDDIIADRIDVVSKTTLALTMTCARCHDHKFDPIPTMDYYSWYGIFNSSYMPEDGMIIEEGSTNSEAQAFSAQLREKKKALEDFKKGARAQVKKKLFASGGDYMLAIRDLEHSTNGNNGAIRNNLFGSRGLNNRWADAWTAELKKARSEPSRIFAPWIELADFRDSEFAARAPSVLAKYRGGNVNPQVTRMLFPAPTSVKQLAARYSRLFSEMEARWEQAAAGANPNAGLADASFEEIRQLFYKPSSKLHVSDGLIDDIYNRDNRIRNRVRDMDRAITEFEASHPGAPRRAVVMLDKKDPRDSHVHIRGSASDSGPIAPRRFLEVLSGDNRPVFKNGSGRYELAQAIASRSNPLTPRVMVNRIWQEHFGEGIVRTPNDFGVHSEKPSHPALLDYLAWTFMEDGWSVKKMHKRIMLSSAYQQSADDNPRYAQIDPGNQLVWRMNRRRLDFEALRDTVLYIGGKLDTTMGGPPVKLDAVPYPERRSVYGLVDRTKLPGMLRAFDFANPDLCTGKRDVTTVPQQALFLMNSPLIVEQAVNLVKRPDFTAMTNPEDRVRLLYRLIYQRAPTDTEIRLSLKYVDIEPRLPKSAILGDTPWEFGIGQFDTAAKRIRSFAPMDLFTNNMWKAGVASLSATGGHTPSVAQSAVVRRWTATADGRATIEGNLQHTGTGLGVQGLIVSSRGGPLGSWAANHNTVPTAAPAFDIQEGDIIDFMVFSRGGAAGDDFTWSPVIIVTDPDDPSTAPQRFDANAGFVGGATSRYHLNAWQKYAQVLLQTNELIFVN